MANETETASVLGAQARKNPTLSDIYEEKVNAGRLQNNRRVGMQMQLARALKETIDDINENDPFIEINISQPSSQNYESREFFLKLNMRQDGRQQPVFYAKYDDEAGDGARFIFTIKGKPEGSFTISEPDLQAEGAFTAKFMDGVASLMAAQTLADEPANMPVSKRDRIFEFRR